MPNDPVISLQDKYSKYGVSVISDTLSKKRDLPKKKKSSVFDKYEVPELDFNFQPDSSTAYMPGYAPQTEESKRFNEEWDQKGAAKRFRDTQVSGWKKLAGHSKFGIADIWEFMAGSMGGLSPVGADAPEVQAIKHKLKESSAKTLSEAPQIPDRFIPQALSMLPQVAGTAVAIAAAPVTGGTSASFVPGLIGTANAGLLATSVYGGSLMDYDNYVEEAGIESDELTRKAVAGASAALEFGLEKVRLGRVIPDGLVTKIATKKLLANPSLADDVMRKWAAKDPTLHRKFMDMGATTLQNMGEEGAEEFLASVGQSIAQNVYLQGEDKFGAIEIWNDAAKGFVGGAMMGGLLGPMSYTSNEMYHKMRQKRNGVTLVETKEGKVFEYLGPDQKNPNMATVMDNRGNVSSINRDVVTDTRTMTAPELKEYLNVYRDTQEGLPEMEAELKRNMARQQIDQVGQSIMFRGSEKPEIRIGKRREDGKMVYIKSTFEDKPGEAMHVVVDAETMELGMLPDLEIETGMAQDYNTWLENETEDLLETTTKVEDAQKVGDEIEQKAKEEAGVQEFHQGEKVLFQNREWLVRENGSDGTMVLEPIDSETGEVDHEEGPIEVSFEESAGVAKYAPEVAPSQEAPTQETVDHAGAEGANQGEQTEQAPHPQARTIDDGKNEYEVLDGRITQTYHIAKQANNIAKKLSEEYPRLVFEVHEFDDGDPFNKNEYTITVDVKEKEVEEVTEEAIEEESPVAVSDTPAAEEMAEIAPETSEVTGELLTEELPIEEVTVGELQNVTLEEVSAETKPAPEEVNTEFDQSEEDAFAETEGFLPEPVPNEEIEEDEPTVADNAKVEQLDLAIEEETSLEMVGQETSLPSASEQFAAGALKSDEKNISGSELNLTSREGLSKFTEERDDINDELRKHEQVGRGIEAAITEEENSKDDTQDQEVAEGGPTTISERGPDAAVAEEENGKNNPQSQAEDRGQEQPEVDSESIKALESEIATLKQSLTETRNARQAKKNELDKRLNVQQDLFAGESLGSDKLFDVKKEGSRENIKKILGEFDNTIARIEKDIDLKEKQLATARKETGDNTVLFEEGQLYRKLAEGEINTAYGSEEKRDQTVNSISKNVRETSLSRDNNRGQYSVREREGTTGNPGRASGSLGKIHRRTVLEGFEEKGYVDFIGEKVSSPQDVADLFAIHRSPNIEKSHIVFVKDGVIVGTTAQTVNKIDRTSMPKTDAVLDLYKKFDADGLYMIHNHPSGNHHPSPGDVYATLLYQEELTEAGARLVGHVVIDTNKFSYIDLSIKPFYGVKNNTYDLESYIANSVQEIDYKNAVPKLFAEREQLPAGMDAQNRMVEISKALLGERGYQGAIIYLGRNLSIAAYDVFPEGANSKTIAHMARLGLQNNLGANVIFIHDGGFQHESNTLMPAETLDLINTQTGESDVFRKSKEDPVTESDVEALWDRTTPPKANSTGFASEFLESKAREHEAQELVDEYIAKASEKVGAKSSDWIKVALHYTEGSPADAINYLEEKAEIYGGHPRIPNRIKRAIDHVSNNTPPPGAAQTKAAHQEGEAGPPNNLITSKGQKFRRMAQDRSLAVRELQNKIKGLGGRITEYSNPYRQENLSHGAVKAAIEDYDKQIIDPLLKTISEIQKSTGMDYKQINEYMMAKHAPERNEALKKESGKDVNAGMTTDDAKAITAKYESKIPQGEVDKLWKQVNRATRFALKRNLNDGYISKEVYDKLTGPEGYEYYVPMRGWAKSEADDLFEYFQGDVGKAVNPFRSAKGRKSLADDPLQYIVNMAHTAIVMGEKNRVKQHLSSLVRGNMGIKDKDNKPLFWFKKVYYVWDGTYDSAGKKNYTEHIEKPPQELWDEGKVEARFNGDHMKRRSFALAQEHEVEVWIGGQKSVMVLPADVAAAVNKTPSSWDNSAYALQKSIGKFTRWLSANFTSKNPAFIPINQVRDLQYAFWAHAIKGEKGDLGQFMKAIPGARGAIIRSLKGRGDMNHKLDKLYRDFKLNGGETGYIHMQDVDQLAMNLKKDLKRLNRKNATGRIASKVYFGAGEMLEHWAIRSENLSRFATYVVAIERGATPKEAAAEAKDITVNFNRAGLSSGVTGSLYAFFNAGIQGGHNAVKMAKDNPGKIAFAGAGMTAMGFLTAMFAHLWAGDDDDDTVNDYEEMNDYHKYNNLTIPVPGKDKFVTIPLPHFFRFFNAVGVLAYQTIVTDEKTTGEAVANGISSLASSVSPVNPVEFFEQGSGIGGAIRPLTPTALVPALDILTNTDFAGNRIRREPFTSSMEGRVANSQLGQKHVNRFLKWTTDQWFKAGGGDPETGSKFFMDQDGMLRRVNDFMDINPSNIEHVFEYYLGGRGRFWNNVLKTGEQVISGAAETVNGDREFREMLSEVSVNNTPVLRRFYSQPWRNSVYTRYYDIINEMEDYKSFVRSQAKLSEGAEMEDLMDAYHYNVSEELKYLREDLKYIDEDIEMISNPEQIEDLKALQDMLIRNFLEVEEKYSESLK